MYVVLLDNHRTDLLEKEPQFESLTCIRCGACLNFCPVFSHIGGYTYNSVYGGPIGSVISPFLFKDINTNHLASACSICGKCTENCPAKINLQHLLLHNRKDFANSKKYLKSDTYLFSVLSKVLNSRFLTNFFTQKLFRGFAYKTVSYLWGKRRVFPRFKESFSKTFKQIK